MRKHSIHVIKHKFAGPCHDQGMFDINLLQAINDWQRGGNAQQKKSRGLRLKEAAKQLDPEFKRVSLCCFRQIALDKSSLWKFGDTLHLTETISAWTTSLELAKQFKGGVPPAGLQGIIFEILPVPSTVIVNLSTLFRDETFRCACEVLKNEIVGYSDGIGRYRGTQHEVLLEIESVSLANVYALGGYSSSHEIIARRFFGHEPTQEESRWFDELLARSARKSGPNWLLGEPKDRVVSKMLRIVETLRPLHP